MDSRLQTLVDKVVETSPQFCAALTRDEIEKFVTFTRFKDISGNEVLYEVGTISDEFYLIVGGEVVLYREELGEEIEVGRLGPGQLTGHMSFFDREPRTVRLSSGRQGAKLLAISRPMYKRLCIEHPYISVNLVEYVVLSLDSLLRSSSREVSSLYKQLNAPD
ncbi:cyclic nucleotide-binding domain-containing protein [Leucothrix sargassi]|nr:cyclic nucleotide-binding domain-containing protein [Leucothrix sargassi]